MLFDHVPAGRTDRTRGAVLSAGVHLALALLAIAVARHQPSASDDAVTPARPPLQLVWVSSDAPAAGGGGGGGGNRRPEPPRRAEAPGRDRLTVRPAPPPDVTPTAPPPRQPEQTLALSAEPLAAGVAPLVGIIEAAPAAGRGATGSGDGPGTDGPGGDSGSGQGRGPGVGPGSGGEEGIGPPGNGVSWPHLVRDVKPAYTAEAMRARITGSVGLSCVVERDGSVRDCRLTRSLDRHHGLDEAALRAAHQWQFVPARRRDEPVPVRVTIDMDFALR